MLNNQNVNLISKLKNKLKLFFNEHASTAGTFCIVLVASYFCFVSKSHQYFENKNSFNQIYLDIPKHVQLQIDKSEFITLLESVPHHDVDHLKAELFIKIPDSMKIISNFYQTNERNLIFAFYLDKNEIIQLAIFKKAKLASMNTELIQSEKFQLLQTYSVKRISEKGIQLSFGEIKFLSESEFLLEHLRLAQQQNNESGD